MVEAEGEVEEDGEALAVEAERRNPTLSKSSGDDDDSSVAMSCTVPVVEMH